MHSIEIIEAGLSDYHDCWRLQKELFARVHEKRKNHYLILTEHKPVITFGRSGDRSGLVSNENYLKSIGIDLVEIDRGGDVTYHGPGQIVGYPILNLLELRKDIHWYLRSLEQIIIDTVALWHISATRIDGLTGAWVEEKKICAIGIKVTRWVTMHGFALNVNTDLKSFNHIIPCGIQDRGVTSIAELTGNIIPLKDVSTVLIKKFKEFVATVPKSAINI